MKTFMVYTKDGYGSDMNGEPNENEQIIAFIHANSLFDAVNLFNNLEYVKNPYKYRYENLLIREISDEVVEFKWGQPIPAMQ